MNTILVPIDYSDACLKALEVALNLGARINGQVLLCHVYQPPVLVPEEDEEDSGLFAMAESDSRNEALAKLRKFASLVKANSPVEVPVTFTVQQGALVEELQKLMKEKKVAMLVMGTKIKSSLLNRVFATATEKLIKEATCPVLAVPEKAQANPFGRVVYATALEPSEENALTQLGQAKKLFSSTLAVLYVDNGKMPEPANITVRKNNLFRNLDDKEIIFSQVISDDVAGGIEEYVEKFNADMVAFTVAHHSFWKDFFHSSVTSKLLHELDLPMLAFPAASAPLDLNPPLENPETGA